jgi:hypothetical protein
LEQHLGQKKTEYTKSHCHRNKQRDGDGGPLEIGNQYGHEEGRRDHYERDRSDLPSVSRHPFRKGFTAERVNLIHRFYQG